QRVGTTMASRLSKSAGRKGRSTASPIDLAIEAELSPQSRARTSGQNTPTDPVPPPVQETAKTRALQVDSIASGPLLTTNQGVGVGDDQNSLRSHGRGPTLM